MLSFVTSNDIIAGSGIPKIISFQLKTPIKPFTAEIRPICLPPIKMWDEKFIQKFIKIYGYGRTESVAVAGKDQAPNSQNLQRVILSFRPLGQ